jgi:hypothetical protein
MKRYIGAASGLFLLLSCLPASSLTLTGAGSETCQAWRQAHASSPATDNDATAAWVFGYLDSLSASVAGNNAVNGQPNTDLLNRLDRQSIVKLVSVYCDGHPDRTIRQAVIELGVQLIAERRPKRGANRQQASTAASVQIRPTRVRAETTGSGDVTGSIRTSSISACKTVDVADAHGQIVHQLRKCD